MDLTKVIYSFASGAFAQMQKTDTSKVMDKIGNSAAVNSIIENNKIQEGLNCLAGQNKALLQTADNCLEKLGINPSSSNRANSLAFTPKYQPSCGAHQG